MQEFSYAYGVAQTNGLVNYLSQRMGVEPEYMEYFLAGFDVTQQTEEDKRRRAYMAGLEIRQQVESQLLPQANRQVNDSIDLIQHDVFIRGFREAVAGTATLEQDSAQAISQRQLNYYHARQMEERYGENLTAGEEFLTANAKKDSVKVTESGLQYKIITVGTGDIPTATQRVKVNYEGHLIDGTVFDSSYQRGQPATFACNQVIRGWTEALTMMPVGSKWELYIPQNLAYGDREAGQIPPFSTLIFTVELLEIEE
ncbi:MAG: FKBP-type peptidyl-prolyl cis-trans isomerase [Bacteroidaceae bacterium]|nr:FKBP-type peptidyl-prolyl cis-trans isomerase [Bacteroidaceae bacterium]